MWFLGGLLWASRGSSASRRPSPAKLKLSTVRLIIAPGYTATHGA